MLKIVSDSSCDRPLIGGEPVACVPMVISTDERSFRDDETLNITEMLDYLAAYKGRSYTSCPSVDSWMQLFEGAGEVCAVTITSALSGSYNSAVAARKLYLQKNPQVRVHIFDTLSTGPEMALLLDKLRELAEQGLSFEEICARGEEYRKKTRLFFTLQSLHNLSQNGRVNKVVAAAIGVLNIRIVGTASSEGTLAPLAKSRGEKKALTELVEQVEKAGYAGGKMRVTHVENPTLARKFVEQVKAIWPGADVTVARSGGLCSYYAERGALLVGIETE